MNGKYTVTYFDANTHKQQTETFGMRHCAVYFALGLLGHDCYRIMQVWDVYKNAPLDLPEPRTTEQANPGTTYRGAT